MAQEITEGMPKQPEIIVKFREGGWVEETTGGLKGDGEIITLKQFNETLNSTTGAVARRSFRTDRKSLQVTKERAEEKLGRRLPSLDLFVRVRLPEEAEVDASELVKTLANDREVNYACLAGIPGPPPSNGYCVAEEQGYREPAADDGVDANSAWIDFDGDGTIGGDGTGVQVCVCERGFNMSHVKLSHVQVVHPPGATQNDLDTDRDHGTRTLGVLGAAASEVDLPWLTGICHGATLKFASEGDGSVASERPDCIDAALSALNNGDVLLLEMQERYPATNRFVPAEFSLDVRQRIMQAVYSDNIVVVAAAGNGFTDLATVTVALETSSRVAIPDLHIWDTSKDPIQYDEDGYIIGVYDEDGNYIGGECDDSGAILVGGGHSGYSSSSPNPPHSYRYPSNYGLRINCQGWGECVATADDGNTGHTDSYDGTSSAAAMVAGVVACLQGAVLDVKGASLSPEKVRNMLEILGTPQVDGLYSVSGYPIGPLPDLSRLLDWALRDPIDVELVMDVSDSMNYPPPTVPGGDPKLALMKQAASIVTNLMHDLGQDNDRMGLVWFTDDASEYESAGQKLFPVQLDAGDLITEIEAHGTGMYTAMGAGLQTAFDTLDDSGQQGYVILCTDGMQNVEPLVTEVGDHYEISGTDISVHNVPLHTIGIGIQAEYEGLLDGIAGATGGFYIGTNAPEDDLDLAYLVALCDSMAGGSPAVACHSIGRLQAKEDRAEEYFYLNRSVRQVTVILSWRESQKSALTFWLHAPDGTLMDLHPVMRHYGSYCLATFRLPIIQNGRRVSYVGQWRMVIRGQAGGPHTDYHAIVVADDPVVKFGLDSQRDLYEVGDVLSLQIKLTELKEPILRIGDLVLEEAYLSVPLAELFAQYSVSSYELKQRAKEKQGEYLGLLEQVKLEMMASDPEFGALLKPTRDRRSLLKGDLECAIEGQELAVPVELRQPGLHTFKVAVRCETPDNGRIDRITMVSVFVEPGKIDPGQTKVVHMEVSEKGQQGVRLLVTPKNKYGQLLGPGCGHQFRPSSEENRLDIQVKDLLNGTYHIELMLSDEQRKEIGEERIPAGLMFGRRSVWDGTI